MLGNFYDFVITSNRYVPKIYEHQASLLGIPSLVFRCLRIKKTYFERVGGKTENEVFDKKYTRKYRVLHTPIKRIRSSASVNIIQPLPIFLRKNGLLKA